MKENIHKYKLYIPYITNLNCLLHYCFHLMSKFLCLDDFSCFEFDKNVQIYSFRLYCNTYYLCYGGKIRCFNTNLSSYLFTAK